jgi:protein-tyrosine phosphatase
MVPTIYPLTAYPDGYLVIMGKPRGGDWLDDEIAGLQQSGIHLVVSLLEPAEIQEVALTHESEICARHGIEYVSFPMPDRGLPPSYQAMTSLITSLQRQLEQGKGVAIHCRAGIGRSGVVAACVFLHRGWTPDQALAVIARDRRVPVPDTPEQHQWIETYYHQMRDKDARENCVL